MAEADAALGRLNDARLENIHETVSEILEDIASHETNEGEGGRRGHNREGKDR